MASWLDQLTHWLYGDDNHHYNKSLVDDSVQAIKDVPGNAGWGKTDPNAPPSKTGNAFKDWLYSSEEWNDDDWTKFYTLYSTPYVGSYIDMLYDQRATQEYLDRYGMDLSDVHDPRKLLSTRSTTRFMASGLNFVSRNVTKLYR